MNPGKLRHKIDIQELASIPDGGGGKQEAWVTFLSAWASIDPLSGRELFAAMQIQSTASHKIKMRYRPGITAKHRIVFGTRIFNIIAPPMDIEERHIEIHLMCEEVFNNG